MKTISIQSSALAVSALMLLIVWTSTPEDEAQEKSPEASELVTASAAAEPELSMRTQFDLAAAIREAEHEQDDDEQAFALAELTDAWQGGRYQWTTTFLAAFCPNAAGCHLVPFDRGGKDKDIVQGWSPQVEMSTEEWQRISETCAETTVPCQVTFVGTLSKFRISTEELTRLTFSDVSIVDVAAEVAL